MQPYYSNLIVNGIAICNLLLILTFTGTHENRRDPNSRFFNGIIVAIFATIILDSAMVLVDTKTFTGARVLVYLFSELYLMVSTLPTLFWLLYVAKHLGESPKVFKWLLGFVLFVELVHTVVIVASIWTGWAFTVNEANSYVRGAAIYFNASVSYLFAVAAGIIIIVRRKCLDRRTFFAMLFFMVPPLICSFVQMAFFGLSLVGLGLSFALLMQYLYVQNDMLYTDELTGLPNRRKLQNHLTSVCHKSESYKYLVGLMMDVDKFKSINDSFGHSVGDKALVSAANILKRSISPDIMLARYAGDEFVIVAETNTEEAGRNIVDNIKCNCDAFNEKAENKYKITFGIGLFVAKHDELIDIDYFLERIDNEMYHDKMAKLN